MNAKPWDNPGTPPTDAAVAQAAAQAASTPSADPNAIGPATAQSGPPSGTNVATQGAAPEVAKDITVTVMVPKAFTLRMMTDNGAHIEQKFETGPQEMLLEHAEHWWSKANGVSIYHKS